MKRTSIIGMSLLLLTACTGSKQTNDSTIAFGKLPLPVSEKQLCLDWYSIFSEMSGEDDSYDEDGNPINMPNQYLVTDLDNDGLAEVLLQGVRSSDAAMLSYDKNGKVKFSDATTDGYLCLGIGKGWYVREFDDHMGEYRTWTKYYYKVENGQFDFIGGKATGFEGLDENGDYKVKESDGTEGKAPSDDEIQMYYNLEGWVNINDDAKSEALTVLADGETCDDADDCGCGEPDDQYFAGEVTLDNGTRLRLD